jgi:hypothetical protein
MIIGLADGLLDGLRRGTDIEEIRDPVGMIRNTITIGWLGDVCLGVCVYRYQNRVSKSNQVAQNPKSITATDFDVLIPTSLCSKLAIIRSPTSLRLSSTTTTPASVIYYFFIDTSINTTHVLQYEQFRGHGKAKAVSQRGRWGQKGKANDHTKGKQLGGE